MSNKTKGQRLYPDADRETFLLRLEAALVEHNNLCYPASIRPPRDFNFAHGVLSGYVTGLSREEK